MSQTQKKFAIKLRQRYGREIYEVCQKHGFKQSWLAGLLGNENANLNLTASRFEKHIYEGLVRAKNGSGAAFWGVWTKERLAAYSMDDLKKLASSWGFGQILGIHHKALGVTLTEFLNADAKLQLDLTVRLLFVLARKYIQAGDYASVLRIWNTGRPDGKTYHAHYVPRATDTATEYEALLKEYPTMDAFLKEYPLG